MAKDLNKWMGIGRLGQDPELKETRNGQKQVMFSIANNEDYTDKDGNLVPTVNWINCVAYGGQAENICKYLRKGSQVAIEGSLTVRNGEDKEGNSRTYWNIRVDRCQFLGGKADGTSTETTSASTPEKYEPYTSLDEDIF